MKIHTYLHKYISMLNNINISMNIHNKRDLTRAKTLGIEYVDVFFVHTSRKSHGKKGEERG